jgi:tetratricopeptide (TPR) repeat protein
MINRLTKTTTALIATILVAAETALPAAAEDVMQLAVQVYKNKEYVRAGEAFYKIAGIMPDNVDAYVYYANCLSMQRKTDEATRAYWYVVRAFPNSRKAYAIKDFLKKSDRLYSQHLNDPSYATFGGKKLGEIGRSSSSRSTSAPSSSKDVVEEIVKVVPPLKNRPSVSLSLIDQAKTALREYPPELLRVVSRGCKIWLTPTMIDKEPSLENQQPAGYMEGHSYKDCPGMFYSGGIVVCEYTIGNGFDWDHVDDPIGTLHHELGHAIDHYLGQISETEEYKHAYLLDCGQIRDDAVRNKIAYFLQKDIRGPHEAFAELMCAKYGGRSGKKGSTTELMNAHFPLTKQVIEKRLAQVN